MKRVLCIMVVPLQPSNADGPLILTSNSFHSVTVFSVGAFCNFCLLCLPSAAGVLLEDAHTQAYKANASFKLKCMCCLFSCV